MAMGRISIVTLWICLSHVKCSVDQVFALKGCNATLEWGLGNLSFMDHVTDIRVLNASDFIMAWTEDGSCLEAKGVSVYCEIRKHGENWLIHVVLIYVTMGNSGRYTCRVQYGITKVMNFTKELMVIDKPQILIPSKTILNHPLDITCTADPRLKGVTYQWKLNGTDLHSAGRIYANSSLLRLESLLTADKSSKFSCELCQQNSCCVTSEPFALDPYYGPDKLALDPDRRNIFLRENEAFTIKCSADCNPVCSVWWEGYINSNKEILVINSFDSRTAGPHICKAKNFKIDITTSETIFLHLAKESSTVASSHEHTEAPSPEHTEDVGLKVLGTGLVIVAVGLVIIGFSVLIKFRRKYICRKSVSRTLYLSTEGRANRELSRELLRFEKQDRPLPFTPVQDNECKNIKSSGHPDGHNKSRSSQTLLDHTKDLCNPVSQSMSMQTLVQISHTTERGSKSDEQTNGATTLSLNNSLHENFRQQSQEDLYSSLDEAAFSVDNISTVKQEKENLQEDHRDVETANYEYDYATLPDL